MDKMIKDGRGEILITNDGATILQKLDVVHPTAKMVRLLLFSLLRFQKHKILRLVMELPLLLFLLAPYSRLQNLYLIEEFIPTSFLKVKKNRCRFPTCS
jgi:hypothetical protein